jgi:uncharacterized membrane protein YGL010W
MKKNTIKSRFGHADLWILAIASVLLVMFVLREILAHTSSFPVTRALLLVMICLLFYIGGFLFSKRTNSKRIL